MVIVLENNKVYDFNVNIPYLQPNIYELKVKSQYSNEYLFEEIINLIFSNSRFSAFTFELDIDLERDINGIYNWELYKEGLLIESGLVKIINKINVFEKERFISNNEKREGVVIYRPEY